MSFTAKSYSCGTLGKVRKLLNLNHGSWVNVPVPQAVAANADLVDVETAPNDGDHVFVVGNGTPAGFYGIAVSTDGGSTWNVPGGSYVLTVQENVNNGVLFTWNEIVVVGPQVYGVSGVSFIVGSPDSMGSNYGTILRSVDGGANYAVLNWYTTTTPTPNPILVGMGCYSVHFPTTLIGVVGLADYVIKTTDGGNNWIIMNGGQALSSVIYHPFPPSPPSLPLPVGPITGINIRPDESHIMGIGESMVVESIQGVNSGVTVDTWKNQSLTANPQFPNTTPTLLSGFTPQGNNPPLKIGWHLNGLSSPDDEVIYISGDAELGATSTSYGSGWNVNAFPGWNNNGTGFSRRAMHYYKWGGLSAQSDIYGFYNKDNTVYWNNRGVNTPFEILSDQPPGLNYIPTAVWTWYNETPDPTCYTLTDCEDGTTIFTTVNLVAYINRVITVSEFPGHCFLVTEGCVQPNTPQIVTYVSDFVDCDTCNPPAPSPCSCPQGTTLITLPNGTKVCREDTISLAEGPDPLRGCDMTAAVIGSDVVFPQNITYNQFGAFIYQDIATRPWPVTPVVDPGCVISNFFFRDNSTAVVGVTNNPVNTLWGNGSSITSGRHNNSAVWNKFWSPSTCGFNPTIGLYGFTHCLTVTATTTYFFATSGRSIQLKINGSIAVENTSGSNFGINTLHVFPITLPAGTYIIEMNGAEVGTGICNSIPANTTGFVWEIYSGPGLNSATLSAMTMPAQLAAVTIYSTVSESGISFDSGSTPFNHRCPQSGQALDNCFANPLNPNANANIYVCHSYVDTPVQGCCYLLTDCNDNNITYITSTDLSQYAYQNQVIKVAEYIGCFIVSEAPNCGPVTPPAVTVTQAYVDCITCLPRCYELISCEPNPVRILTNTDLSALLGQVINIAGSTTCYTVAPAQGCQGSIAVVVTATFITCEACQPVCYQLINCKDPNDTKITSTDLSLYLIGQNQVIYIEGCPGVCWQVTLAGTCVGAVPVVVENSFLDCDTCSPPPPPPLLELRPRAVKPGYDTPGCDPAYTEKISCNFANAVYDQMIITRYGVTLCCNDPIEKWAIKKQLLDLAAIYDAELCKNTFDKCCPPCALVVTITPYYPQTCNPPTNVVVVLNIPPSTCLAPINVQVTITLNPFPCICYLITITSPGVPCNFEYVNCSGVIVNENLFLGINYICSQVVPTTLCVSGNYTIQSTPGDCLLGTCGAP